MITMNDTIERTSKRLWKQTIRAVALPLGVAVIAIGLVLAPLPIPFGLPLVLVGLFVAAANPLGLKFIRRQRSKFPEFSAKLRKLTPSMPGFIQTFLKKTDLQLKNRRHRAPDQAPFDQ